MKKSFLLSWSRALSTLTNPIPKTLHKTQITINLSPKIVKTTISNCPSDTISLTFFLWCARQKDYFHDPNSYDVMVPVVRRLNDRFKSVRNVIEELKSAGSPLKAQTFLVLLRIYWRGGLYRFALELFDEMSFFGFEPNTFARNVIIDVLFKINHVDAAMRVWRETQLPNFLTYSILLINLCKINNWLEIRNVLRIMIKRGFYPNSGTFTAFFDCCRKKGNISELFQLLAFMTVSNTEITLAIWSILIEKLCHEGDLNLAFIYVEKMRDLGISPTIITYTSLLKGLFKAREYDSVNKLLDFMQSVNCKPDLVFYNVLMDCFVKEKRYNDAIGVYSNLIESNLKPDQYTIATLMSILPLIGNMNLFGTLISNYNGNFDLIACNSVLNTLCKAGYPIEAVGIFNSMIERGLKPDNYTYVGLLSSLCQLGWTNNVVNIYNEIITENPNLDSYVHATILSGLVKRGKYNAALKLFRKGISQKYNFDSFCYTIALNSLFKTGMLKEACDLFNEMKKNNISRNTYTYNVMLHGFTQATEIKSVREIIQEMEFDQIEMDCVSYNILIPYFVKLNRNNLALGLLKGMIEKGLKPNEATYLLVSRYFGQEIIAQICNSGTESMGNKEGGSGTDYSSGEILMCSNL